MRVLLTHELYPPDLAGGGEHVVQHAAEGLQRLGAELRVLTTGDPRITEYRGIPTLRLPVHKYRFNFAVSEIVREARDADVIQTFTYHAALPSLMAARKVGIPVVLGCLGLFGNAWRGMRGPVAGRLWQMWEKQLMTRPYDNVVFLSEYSRQEGLRLGVNASRASVACPGVNAHEINPFAPKSNKVLFVGKLHQRKGIDIVMETARALPEIPFDIAGWGEELPQLRAQAPPNVRFLDFVGGDGLWPVFESASIFFLPSRAETFGMAVLQAMAAGCAVVSTVSLDYAGAQVPVDDRAAMVEAITRLWNDPSRTRSLGRLNAETARGYNWNSFCQGLMRAYESSGVDISAAAAKGMRISTDAAIEQQELT